MKLTHYRRGYQRLLAFAQQKGYKVVYKSARVLKDYIGMNPIAAKSMGFPMPDDEIWVLKSSRLPTKYTTLKQHSARRGRGFTRRSDR